MLAINNYNFRNEFLKKKISVIQRRYIISTETRLKYHILYVLNY